MSLEADKPKRKKINLEKLAEFFEKVEISGECPFCKEHSWSIPLSASIGGSVIPWGPGDGNMFMTGIPVVAMTCKKCFFVRQHSIAQHHLGQILDDADDAE